MTDREVREDQVRALFRQSGPVFVTNVVNALIVSATLWTRGSHLRIGVWFGCVIAMVAIRIELARRFRRALSASWDPVRWGLSFATGSVTAGILWGAAAASFFALRGTVSQLLLTFVVAGMSAAAAGTLSCYLPAFFGFIIPALAPFAVRVAVMGDPVHQAMGLMMAIFCLGLSAVAILTNRSLSESFRLRIEKDRLLLQLAESRRHLETMNQTLEARVAERTTALERQTEALRAAQRLEGVGRLAGGIAHDFNNLLSGILWNTTAIFNEAGIPSAIRDGLNDIRGLAERGAGLVRQLLLFSRRQPSDPRTISLNQVVVDMQQLLGGIAGEDLEMKVSLSEALPTVHMDPTRVEQLLVNLVSNARDATPKGGRITIETTVTEVAESAGGVPIGLYAVLSVRDTGAGMDPATRDRAFDPFFTTKEIGKGSGLGLAAVYGIVEESAGHILVESQPNAGSCFKVFFPTQTS